MIRKYVADLAAQMGITISSVSFIEGREIGFRDLHLLHLGVNDQLVSALVRQPELNQLQNGACCEPLEMKVRTALSRLQMLQET